MTTSGHTRRQFGRISGAAIVSATATGVFTTRALAVDAIRIAAVDSFSGPVGNLGHGTFNGEQIALDEINAAGGIKALGGRKLELIRYDTQGSVQAGQAAAEKAIQEGAVALIGTCQSNVTLATTTVAERARIPQVVSGSNAPEVTSRGYKFTFRVLVNAAVVSSRYIDSFQDLYKQAGIPLKTVLCLYEDGAYGQSSFKAYVEGAQRLGLALNGIATKTGSADFSSVVARARDAKPDLLMFVGLY
jgi:branched-chain amino acid transport system substrate-binding protein